MTVNDLEQHVDGGPPHGADVMGDGGEGRIQEGKPFNIVEGHQGHVRTRTYAETPHGGNCADRHRTVSGQQGGGGFPQLEQMLGCGRAARGTRPCRR